MAAKDCWGKYIAFTQKLFEADDFYINYLPFLAEISKPQLLVVGEYDMTCGKYEQKWFEKMPRPGSQRLLQTAHI